MAFQAKDDENISKRPQVNIADNICRKIASPFRRMFAELELIQVKKDGIATEACGAIEQVTQFIKDELGQAYGKPVISCEDEEIPTNTDCCLLNVGGSLRNIIKGLEPVTVSFVFVKNGKADSAYIYFPLQDTSVIVERGDGAKNTGRLRVSGCETITDSTIGVFSSVTKELVADSQKTNSSGFCTILEKARSNKIHVRISGNPTVDLVNCASGKLDGYIGLNLSAHDLLLGELIIKETNGVCSDINGEAITTTSSSIVAGNHKIYKGLVQEIL